LWFGKKLGRYGKSGSGTNPGVEGRSRSYLELSISPQLADEAGGKKPNLGRLCAGKGVPPPGGLEARLKPLWEGVLFPAGVKTRDGGPVKKAEEGNFN